MKKNAKSRVSKISFIVSLFFETSDEIFVLVNFFRKKVDNFALKFRQHCFR